MTPLKKLRSLLALLVLCLPLLLGVGPCDDAEAECASYCRTYWASDPAQYQRCMEDCER